MRAIVQLTTNPFAVRWAFHSVHHEGVLLDERYRSPRDAFEGCMQQSCASVSDWIIYWRLSAELTSASERRTPSRTCLSHGSSRRTHNSSDTVCPLLRNPPLSDISRRHRRLRLHPRAVTPVQARPQPHVPSSWRQVSFRAHQVRRNPPPPRQRPKPRRSPAPVHQRGPSEEENAPRRSSNRPRRTTSVQQHSDREDQPVLRVRRPRFGPHLRVQLLASVDRACSGGECFHSTHGEVFSILLPSSSIISIFRIPSTR
jgi:hypothetical protein